MRCVVCGKFSFKIICKNCQKRLVPNVTKRNLDDDFFCYSFFAYNDIAPLLHFKHKPCGDEIYKILAQNSFKPFFESFCNALHEKTGPFCHEIGILPIDDRVKGGYSHTAVLAKYGSCKYAKVFFKALRSQNNVTYSGKSLSFRKSNPRNFKLNLKTDLPIVIIDDLVTSGITLLEAKKVLQKHNLNPIFALTLADAKVK